MDENAKVTADEIESGEYFSEAKKWYNKLFISLIRDAVAMRLMGYTAIVVVAILGTTIYGVFPLVEKVDIITYLNDTINFFPKIVKLNDPQKTVKQFVVEELGSRYIRERESYDPKRFKVNYIFILKNSSKEIFDAYYDHINSKESNSPQNLAAYKNTAKVKVLSTQTAVGANKVTVVFAKGIFNEFEELQSSSKWKADIEFYLSKYDFSKATDANLDFIVTKYTVNKIETP